MSWVCAVNDLVRACWALGMACNATYSFWTPLFRWLLLGVVVGQDGWALPGIVWVGAVVTVVGILLIAVNPLTLVAQLRGTVPLRGQWAAGGGGSRRRGGV